MLNQYWNGLKEKHKSWLAAVAVVVVLLALLLASALSSDPFIYSLF
jgi:hypothetical protein